MSSVAKQKVNIHLPLKCYEIKIESNQKPYHSSPPQIAPSQLDAHGSSRGGREERKKEMKPRRQERSRFCSWHRCETFWRLWNGSRPRPDPSRNRASGVAREKTCIPKMEKAKKAFTSEARSSLNCQVDRFSLLTSCLIFPFERGLDRVTPLKLNITQAKTTSGVTGGICSTGDRKASLSCSQAVIWLPVCSQIPSILRCRFET